MKNMWNKAIQCYKRASSHHRVLPSHFPHSIIPWTLNKSLNRFISCLTVHDAVQGFLTYLQERRGAQQGKARPEQEGGRRARGQHVRWGQQGRERGKDVWMLNTVMEGKREIKFHAGAAIMNSIAEIPCFAGERFPWLRSKGWALNSAEN